MPNSKLKKYKKVVDDHTKDFGDTDFDKHLIRINKTMNKKKGSQGELINTIAHEFNHVKHPRMKEKNIEKFTLKTVKHLSKKSKAQDYKMFEKKKNARKKK